MKPLSILAATFVLVAGCTSTEALGDRALEYNRELEQSTNITVLTNVVRASKRLPMTFSRLGTMSYTGSLGLTPSASFGVGANSAAANDVIGLSVESNDSGVTPLEALTGQKYHRAISKSIEPEMISFYRDRGWSDVLLFSLFIEKIYMEEKFLATTQVSPLGLKTMVEAPDTYRIFDNDPDDVDEYLKFLEISEFVAGNFDVNLETEEIEPDKVYYPEPFCKFLRVNADKEAVVSAARPFTVVDCKSLGGYEPVMDVSNFDGLEFKSLPKEIRVLRGVAFRKQKSNKVLRFTPKSTDKGIEDEVGCTVSIGERYVSTPSKCKVRIVLRSPKDMLYYLGELVRAQKDLSADYQSKCPMDRRSGEFRFGYKKLCAGSDDESLFYLMSSENVLVARGAGIASNKLFEFEYNGTLYWVPSDAILRGRTMQVVALLNELFYLNQEASEAPVVSVIQGATIR